MMPHSIFNNASVAVSPSTSLLSMQGLTSSSIGDTDASNANKFAVSHSLQQDDADETIGTIEDQMDEEEDSDYLNSMNKLFEFSFNATSDYLPHNHPRIDTVNRISSLM